MTLKKKKVAIIDLGTNTFHLLIAEIGNNKPAILHKETIAVKIGEGGISKSFISLEAQKRGISALQLFRRHIEKFKVDDELAFATSAFRTAGNSSEFLNKISKETGFDPRIINGSQEAQFIYQGVRAGLELSKDPALIIDIGGGSVEFIIAEQHKVKWYRSYEIGAQRLMDQFHKIDPIPDNQLLALEAYLDIELSTLLRKIRKFKPVILVGVAGTFDTLNQISELRDGLSSDFKETEGCVTIKDFEEIYPEMTKKSLKERLETPGLVAFRAGMIVVALALVNWILKQNPFEEIRISKYSLKEGVLYTILKDQL